MGLRIMRYRARMIGADVNIRRRREEGGTEVSCQYIPPRENSISNTKPTEALS